MSNPLPRAGPYSLARVRRRLTLWYAGTFLAILVLLGVGMFAVITRRFDMELDDSLRAATDDIERLSRDHDIARLITEIRIADRTLLLLDTLGTTRVGPTVGPWLGALALQAWRRKEVVVANHHIGPERTLRVVARPIHRSPAFVAVAMADEIELEDRYQSLILSFSVAAGVAVLLVILGGWALARQAMAPVDHAFDQMRRFMADAAHELRAPITVVRGRAEVALQQPRASGEYVAALNGIEREAERLSSIVDDLLILARADAGERAIEHRRLFLDDILLESVDAARAMAVRKSIAIEVDAYEEAPVEGDAELLRRLIIILMDNAIKYTGPSGVVRVGVLGRGARVVLTIRDTGIGIPNEQLPLVFDRFFRGDEARTRTTDSETFSEGAGLGLSIAQWIVSEHKGAIHIESAVGAGTLVRCEFPMARLAQPAR